jgi:hypothetical protein
VPRSAEIVPTGACPIGLLLDLRADRRRGRQQRSGVTGMRDLDLDAQQPPGGGAAEHLLRASPLGGDDEEGAAVRPAERTREAAPVDRDRLQHLAAFPDAYAALVRDVGVPDRSFGIDTDPVGHPLAELSPDPRVRQAAVRVASSAVIAMPFGNQTPSATCREAPPGVATAIVPLAGSAPLMRSNPTSLTYALPRPSTTSSFQAGARADRSAWMTNSPPVSLRHS